MIVIAARVDKVPGVCDPWLAVHNKSPWQLMSNYFRRNEVMANIQPGYVKHPSLICHQVWTLQSLPLWGSPCPVLYTGVTGATRHIIQPQPNLWMTQSQPHM